MTNPNISTESLITEFHALTTQNNLNSYRKGEILEELSTRMEFSEVCTALGIAKSQAYNLRNITAFGTPDDVELVGVRNVIWLSTKSRTAQKEEIQCMVESGESREDIHTRIQEMKEELKHTKPSTTPSDKTKELEQEVAWLRKALEDTMAANEAASDVIDDLLHELEIAEAKATCKPTAPTKTGRELQQLLIDNGYGKPSTPVEEPVKEEAIPQDIIDEVLSMPEEVSEEEDMQLEFVEVEVEPSITESQYEKAKTLVSLGIGSEVDIATVDEYEKEHQIGKYSPDMKARLARVGIHRSTTTPTKPQRKVFVGYESEDEAFGSEAMDWE